MELFQHQLICLGLLLLAHHGWSVCYFPGELQGTWATQTSTSQQSDQRGQRRAPIAYSLIDVHADRISVWGQCHARLDNNIILSDRTRDSLCYRCFHFNVVSANVVQVSSSGLDACYTSEAAATATCPTIYQIRSKQTREIMLYKRTTPWGENGVTQVECPLNGVYTFTYNRGTKNGVREARCNRPTSELSNCPYGFGLNIKYKECSFSNINSGLQCLGSWTGADEREYITVWDPNIKDGDDQPMYKCGMYEEEAGTGNIYLAFSEDSTCFNGLQTPRDGYEVYKLMSVASPALPPAVARSTCNFPRQLQGYWHHTYVSPDTIVFRDYRNFKTYSAKCVRDLDDNERYIVYARTHCGDWSYNCIWLKRRSANVLEFMMGLYPSESFDYSLCDPDKFGDMTSWTTQGKTLVEQPVTCPIIGTYSGELPDAPGFCAQLFSDCDSPDRMYYTVGDCRNNSSVYEHREQSSLRLREESPVPLREESPILLSESTLYPPHQNTQYQTGVIQVGSGGGGGGWVPPELTVGTGAILTITEEGRGNERNRGKRQVRRVNLARTTTISWLWGAATSAPTTPKPFVPENENLPEEPLPEGNLEDFINPDTRAPYRPLPPVDFDRPSRPISSSDNRPSRPISLSDNSGSWLSDSDRSSRPISSSDNSGSWSSDSDRSSRPISSSDNRGSWSSDSDTVNRKLQNTDDYRPITENSDQAGNAGRATWVPGPPPGFNAQGNPTQSAEGSRNSQTAAPQFQRQSVAALPASTVRPGPENYHRPISGSSKQEHPPLKQEREYRCLGQWEEEGHLYALTYRPDINSYECFVGKLKNNDQVVYIKEAGSSCTRGLLPEVLGMKMHRKDACTASDSSIGLSTTKGAQASVGSPRGPPTKPPWLRTTKPWKPIFTNSPEKRSSSCKSLPSVPLMYTAILVVFTLMQKIYSF